MIHDWATKKAIEIIAFMHARTFTAQVEMIAAELRLVRAQAELMEMRHSAETGLRVVPVEEWQPIDTAPKDGTKIIYLNGDEVSCCRWAEDDAEWWNDYTDQYAHPIYWMPIPESPK